MTKKEAAKLQAAINKRWTAKLRKVSGKVRPRRVVAIACLMAR